MVPFTNSTKSLIIDLRTFSPQYLQGFTPKYQHTNRCFHCHCKSPSHLTKVGSGWWCWLASFFILPGLTSSQPVDPRKKRPKKIVFHHPGASLLFGWGASRLDWRYSLGWFLFVVWPPGMGSLWTFTFYLSLLRGIIPGTAKKNDCLPQNGWFNINCKSMWFLSCTVPVKP